MGPLAAGRASLYTGGMARLAPSAARFAVYLTLRSVDPARSRSRSYTLMWRPSLFGGGVLVRTWGRTGDTERTRFDAYPDRAGAQAHVEAILRLRHGYRVVAWQ